jgi:hypothetical protein
VQLRIVIGGVPSHVSGRLLSRRKEERGGQLVVVNLFVVPRKLDKSVSGGRLVPQFNEHLVIGFVPADYQRLHRLKRVRRPQLPCELPL